MESSPRPDRMAFTQSVGTLVTRLVSVPAIAVNDIGDILTTNMLAGELFSEFSIRDNLVRMIFLDAAAKCCVDSWHAHARDAVAGLRHTHRHSPDDRASGLVTELLRSSTPFRAMWTQRVATPRPRMARVFPHCEMGRLVVDEVILSSAAEPRTAVVAYVPAPGSASDDALRILGALHAT
jgi:MmyB-like transcription regulator ligand binding domain